MESNVVMSASAIFHTAWMKITTITIAWNSEQQEVNTIMAKSKELPPAWRRRDGW